MKLLSVVAAAVLPALAAASPYDIAEQASVFARLEGYWVGTGEFRYGTTGTLQPPSKKISFINATFDGDRFYDHRYMVFPDYRYASAGDTYAITSYQDKDLRLVGDSWEDYPADHETFRIKAVDDDTVLIESRAEPFHTSTFTFINDDMMRGVTEIHSLEKDMVTGQMEFSPLFSAGMTYQRVATAEEWIDQIFEANLEYNIADAWTVALPSGCLDETDCITEEDWIAMDPKLNEDEPEEDDEEPNVVPVVELAAEAASQEVWRAVAITLAVLVGVLAIALIVVGRKAKKQRRDVGDEDTVKEDIDM